MSDEEEVLREEDEILINEAHINQGFVVNIEEDDDEFHSANEGDEDADGELADEEVARNEEENARNSISEDNSDESEEDEKREIIDSLKYHRSLATSHSYMGEDMESLSGRTILEEDEVVIMPLFFLPDVVLVPGQILPLNLFHQQRISMMKKVIAFDKTFGLMFRRSEAIDGFAKVGVSCEIFSVKEGMSGLLNLMSVKAEGRQRFLILEKKIQLDGVIMGKVKILPEADLPPCPPNALLYTQYLHRNSVQSQRVSNACQLQNKMWKPNETRFLLGFNRKHISALYTSLSAYPGWVYKLYNPYFLMDCLLHEIRSWNQNIDLEMLPKDPLIFSHWITSNLPLTNDMKIELLQIDSTALRLRKQIELMTKCGSTLVCTDCSVLIADKNDLFSLSNRGPVGAYVNPGGAVHETVTFYKAQNVTLRGRSSEEYSWFPGYAWTIACCSNCGNHMGWKFTAAKRKLHPKKFWGLTRASLRPVFKEEQNNRDCPTCSVAKDTNSESNHDDVSIGNTLRTSNIQYESNI